MLPPLKDHEIRKLLLEIGRSGNVFVMNWEQEYILDLHRHYGFWSVEQRAMAYKIVKKYEKKL